MNNSPENMQNPERQPDHSVTIDPELLVKLATYVDLINNLNTPGADILLDHDIDQVTVEGLVNTAVRSYIEGVESELYDNRSDLSK